jgi:hypothetical protein
VEALAVGKRSDISAPLGCARAAENATVVVESKAWRPGLTGEQLEHLIDSQVLQASLEAKSVKFGFG